MPFSSFEKQQLHLTGEKKKQKKKNKWKCERNDTYTAGGKIARIENLNDESSEDKTFSG